MRKSLFRYSRAGLSHMAIAGIVAGVAVVGYLGYTWYKNRQNPTSSSYGQYAGQQQQHRRPVQQYPQQQFQQVQQGPKGYAFAPANTERDASGQDPELTRLYNVAQNAQVRFAAAASAGDSARLDVARQELTSAQAALNAKKASMY